MKTVIIMVRHGFSSSNEKHTFTGSMESPLTETGRKQAEMAAEYLEKYKIDKIYSSDLSRAYDTAVPIAKSHNLEIIKNKKLREIDAGDWENRKFSDLAVTYKAQYDLWLSDIGKCCPENGETVEEFYNRIKTEAYKIAEENKGKTVCLATHATPIRVMKCEAVKAYLNGMKDVKWSPNASISIFEYENGELTLTHDGITEHLGEFVTALPKNV